MPTYRLLGVDVHIPSVDDIAQTVISPIQKHVTTNLAATTENIRPQIESVVNALTPFFPAETEKVKAFFSRPLAALQTEIEAVLSKPTPLPAEFSVALEGVNRIINAEMSSTRANTEGLIGSAQSEVHGAIALAGAENSRAIQETQGTMLTAFDGMGTALSGSLERLFPNFGKASPDDLDRPYALFVAQAEGALGISEIMRRSFTPEDAMTWLGQMQDYWDDAFRSIYGANTIITIASLGQVGLNAALIQMNPVVGAGLAAAKDAKQIFYEVGIKPALIRWYNEAYQTQIPAYGDLISIYVREGYMKEKWVELPDEMVAYFKQLGYSEDWTKRLWGKHWVLPSPTQLYEMLHRTAGNFPEIGVTSKVLSAMLKYHDFEPTWRMPLEAISWNTWRIFDIRVGWEMEILSDTGLVKRLIDTGYEPKDAALLAQIQKMFVLRSEIDGLLSEADTDFISGWISETQLKADYEATPYNASIVAMRVERAKLRQDRKDREDLKAALLDRFIKGDLTETDFAKELSRLGLQQYRIAIEVVKANAKKLKTVKEETALTTKPLTEAKYSRAYKVGLISEEEYQSALAALKFSPEDIDLLVELNTPEKPAPEELPTLTLGELKAAYRVGVLTENEFAAELDFRRYSPEDITIIIETERAKVKPKVEE